MSKQKIKFSKDTSINHNVEKTKNNPQDVSFAKRQRVKLKIMDKFNLSEDEVEKILNNLENEARQEQVDNKKISEKIKKTKVIPVEEKQDSIIHQVVKKEKSHVSESTNNQENVFSPEITESNSENSNDVDEILSDIIPEYNKNISIEVEHVDLTFEVSTEKIDTLKEKVIRTLKRDKSDKMRIHALNDISFKIYKGEKVGVIGYNGAGKSTLLHVICGAYAPDKGSVKTYGNISPLLGLGAGFDHNYSGRKNIFFNGAVLGYDKQFLKQKEQEIIEFSELGEFIDMPIKNYSSGMLSKLGFSIATIVNPDILIVDEVLGVGDVTFAKKSSDKIKSLMDGGTTVLLVSHSIPTIRQICDKAIWIDNGKVREIGEVNKVCDHYLKDAEKATNEQLANIQFR